MVAESHPLEASQWLQNQAKEVSGFACNRFKSLGEARLFVQGLYARGARQVLVVEDSIQWEEQPGHKDLVPYADALHLFFEKNSSACYGLLNFCVDEANKGIGFCVVGRSVYAAEAAIVAFQEGQLELWWD